MPNATPGPATWVCRPVAHLVCWEGDDSFYRGLDSLIPYVAHSIPSRTLYHDHTGTSQNPCFSSEIIQFGNKKTVFPINTLRGRISRPKISTFSTSNYMFLCKGMRGGLGKQKEPLLFLFEAREAQELLEFFLDMAFLLRSATPP